MYPTMYLNNEALKYQVYFFSLEATKIFEKIFKDILKCFIPLITVLFFCNKGKKCSPCECVFINFPSSKCLYFLEKPFVS